MVLPSSEPRQVEPPRPNPRFIAGLVVTAGLLLGIGASFRPGREQVTTAVPSNELATLPELSQRRALRDLADYFTERSTTSASSVMYLPEYSSSGLVVAPDTVLTVTVPSAPERSAVEPVHFLKLTLSRPDSTRRIPSRRSTDTLRSQWALVVARGPDNQTLSLPGLLGGSLRSSCGELELRELVFDRTVPPVFRGGGVFDLDGNALALAVPCAERTMLVPLSAVFHALVRQESSDYRAWVDLGFRAAPADSLPAPSPAAGASRLRVTEIRQRSPAGRAGLRPGDVILQIERRTADTLTTTRVVYQRDGRQRTVLLR